VELFEQIRREYEHGVGTIKGLARKLGVHRRMVRKPLRTRYRRRGRGRFTSGRSWSSDRVHRWHSGIRPEGVAQAAAHGASDLGAAAERDAGDRSRREHSATIRAPAEAGDAPEGRRDLHPQSYRWGYGAQVDWYEAWAELEGERQKLFVFCMRSTARQR
jgi:hypothetical protein